MALLFADGFDCYSAAADFAKRWNTPWTSGFLSTGGKFGGGCAGSSFLTDMLKTLPSSVAAGGKIRMAAWFQYPGVGSSPAVFRFNTSGGGGVQPICAVDGLTGKLNVYKLGTTTAPILTSTALVGDGQWHWIEIEILLATTAVGTVALYIDGVSQGSLASTITVNSTSFLPITQLGIYANSSVTAVFDDVIMWNDQGTDFTAFPIGPQKITTLKPTGDGSPSQFTPNTGTTHYSQVVGGFANANYVQDGGTGNVDLYTYAGLGYTPSSINAVVASYWAQNPGTATSALIPKLKTGSTTVSGTTFTMGSAGVNSLYTQTWYKDADNAAWTAATVNAMQIGMGD